jgi:hypothetical protein
LQLAIGVVSDAYKAPGYVWQPIYLSPLLAALLAEALHRLERVWLVHAPDRMVQRGVAAGLRTKRWSTTALVLFGCYVWGIWLFGFFAHSFGYSPGRGSA